MPNSTSAPILTDPKQDTSSKYPIPFGSYLLLDAFAHGGMGEVYLAKTGGIEGIERICVVKKLRADVTKNNEYVNRFLDEARVVVNLNHANICHVFDAGVVGDEYYLAMEYISGVNLRDIQKQAYELQRCLSPGVVIWMVACVLEGLDYAHRHCHPLTGKPLHLVHRDISPQNMMVSFEGEVKLIDFGLAASELKIEQTESQVVMGKVAYMSPEQARGEEVDAASDQFSAAVVLYELLVGDRYYGPKTSYEIWQVVGVGGFEPRRWYLLDPVLKGILKRALDPSPEKRYPTCGDFKDALYSYLLDEKMTMTNRGVRDAVRDFFSSKIEDEKNFLSQFTDLSAVALRQNSRPNQSESGKVVTFPDKNNSGTLPYGASPPKDEADQSNSQDTKKIDNQEEPNEALDTQEDVPGVESRRYDKTVIVQNRTLQKDVDEDVTSRLLAAAKMNQGKHVALLGAVAMAILLAIFATLIIQSTQSSTPKTTDRAIQKTDDPAAQDKAQGEVQGSTDKVASVQNKRRPPKRTASSSKPRPLSKTNNKSLQTMEKTVTPDVKKGEPAPASRAKAMETKKDSSLSVVPINEKPQKQESFAELFNRVNKDNTITRSEAKTLLDACGKPCSSTWKSLLEGGQNTKPNDPIPQLAKASLMACFQRCSQP